MFDGYRIRRWERRRDVRRLLAALDRRKHTGTVLAALGAAGDERAIGPLLAHVEDARAIAALDRIERRGHRFFVGEFIDALRRHSWPGISRGEFTAVGDGVRQLLRRRAVADDGPALIGLMDDTTMPFDLRTAAVSALAGLDDKPARAHLIDHMKRGPKAMPEVFHALAGTGDRAVVADLTEFVAGDREFTPDAFLALASRQDPATLDTLTTWVRRSWRVSAAEVEALAAIPGEAADRQLWALMSELPERKGELTELIGAATLARRTPAGPEVLAALGHTSARVRRIALAALGQGADPAHFDAIAIGVKDEDAGVRRAALLALDEYDDPRVTDILVAVVTDPAHDPGDVLRGEKHRRATGPLIAWLRTGSGPARPRVVRALGRLGGDEAVTALLGLFESARPGEKPVVAAALGDTGDPRCVPPLLRALNDFTGSVALALAEIGDPAVLPELRKAHRPDSNADDVKAAVERLEEIEKQAAKA